MKINSLRSRQSRNRKQRLIRRSRSRLLRCEALETRVLLAANTIFSFQDADDPTGEDNVSTVGDAHYGSFYPPPHTVGYINLAGDQSSTAGPETGSIIVQPPSVREWLDNGGPVPDPIRSFNADMTISSWWDSNAYTTTGGFSFGFGNLSGNAFDEDGDRRNGAGGLWVLIDTFDIPLEDIGISVFYGQQLQTPQLVHHWTYSDSEALLGHQSDWVVDVTSAGVLSLTFHPEGSTDPADGALEESLQLPDWDPHWTWEFGVGAATGLTPARHKLDNMLIEERTGTDPAVSPTIDAGDTVSYVDIHVEEFVKDGDGTAEIEGESKAGSLDIKKGKVEVTPSGTLDIETDIEIDTGAEWQVNGHAEVKGSVNSSGTTSGSGTIVARNPSSLAIVSTGNSPGELGWTGDVSITDSLVVELEGTTAGSEYDQLSVNGNITLRSPALDSSLGFTPSAGQEFVIIDNDGTDAVQGTFDGLSEGQSFNIEGKRFHITYRGGDGNDVVLSRNQRPTGRSLARSVGEDRTLKSSVPHDDPDGDRTTVSLVSGPSNSASFHLGSDGTFRYRARANWSGSDSFKYRVHDGEQRSSSVYTATIRVTPVADAPTLSVTNAAGKEGAWAPLNIGVVLTDTNGSQPEEISGVQISGLPAGSKLNQGVELGGGAWRLTESELSGLAVIAPDNMDFSLSVTATSTEPANGDTASCAPQTLSVALTNVDPVLDVAGPQSISEGEVLRIPNLGTFTDPGFNNPGRGTVESFAYTIDWGDGTALDTGSARVDASGSFTTDTKGSFDGSHVYADNGRYTVIVTVADDDRGSDTAAFQVEVENIAPTLTVTDNQPSNEGALLKLTDIGVFTDPGFDNDQPADVADRTVESFTYTVDWGDGTPVDTGSATVDTPGAWGATTATSTDTVGSFDGSHTYGDNGTYTVTVRVEDDDGGWDEQSFSVEVDNVRPTLDGISDLTGIREGSFIELPPATFSDPGFDFGLAGTEENFTATIDWGDGTTEPVSDITLVEMPGSEGAATTGTIAAEHAYADDGTYIVTVTVSDDDDGTHQQLFTVDVLNVVPEVTGFDGSSLNLDDNGKPIAFSGVRGQTLYFDGLFSDPGFDNPDNPTSPGGETHEMFTYRIEWGDGTYDTAVPSWNSGSEGTPSTGGFGESHVYVEEGTYQISVTVTDDDEGTSDAVVEAATVEVVSMQQGGDLAVGGSQSKDRIQFRMRGRSGDVEVLLDGDSLGRYQPDGRLLAFGQAGNDELKADGNVTQDAWLYGHTGNDRLQGGAGNDVLFGGLGDDRLLGKRGRDLLIGGLGADRIIGNSGDDLLIAGYTIYDDDDPALEDIMRVWTDGGLSYSERVERLDGDGTDDAAFDAALTELTVHDDDEEDKLTGASGENWLLADSDDLVTGLAAASSSNGGKGRNR